jgi:hypothetical protein
MPYEPEPIPADAVWFKPEDFREILEHGLREPFDSRRITFANDLMDAAHGEW